MTREIRLFQQIKKEAANLAYQPYTYNSQIWELLGTILAYYDERGTSPEKMIESKKLKYYIAQL